MSSPGKLEGLAIVFDEPAHLAGFDEIVARSARIHEKDIRALVNHVSSEIVGRQSAGTLRTKRTAGGLAVSVDLPDNTLGHDLAESVRRGDVSQMSFGFRVLKDEWRQRAGGKPLRILTEFEIFDVSAVTFPAYQGTRIWLAGTKARSSPLEEIRRRRLALAESSLTPEEKYGRRIARPSWFTKRSRERIGCGCRTCLREALAA